ncbi:MAG: fumarylacetoacetate hydrolase family protein [Nocardiopsaceae bacterium]|nr:fumarylacetoacetate hydrolase family protein [Nocardiopsaceae bacterium]
MQLVRFVSPGGHAPRLGRLAGGQVVPLPPEQSVAGLLALPLPAIRELCEAPGGEPLPVAAVTLLAPADGLTEVWAAGVTYERSRAARVAESEHEADIYERVYGAARPELFFKSAAWRVAGPGSPVSVRADSGIDVPEPELAAVLNAGGEIVGYTICNDMSSRSIEGENPLYLPQAKIYLGGCALGPGIRPAWEVPDPYALTIEMAIHRGGPAGGSGGSSPQASTVVWQDRASTAGLRRRVPELAEFLFREDEFPGGVVLSTGTSVVPELPFTLQPGDEVRIRISELGELANPVVRGKAAVRHPQRA